MAHAQADGRGGAGARIAAIRAEARGGRRGGRRRLPSTLHPDGREHGQARDLLSTETSQTAGPSLPQVPQPSQARDLPGTSSLVLSRQGRPADPAARGHDHGQARDLFSTETSQAAGPSRPTSPFAAPPRHVNRFDSDDNLVDDWGNVIDMNAVEFEVCDAEQQQGHDIVFNMSTPTRGMVKEIEQQQRRGENEIDLCLNI